ncbi:adenylate/guanylate cyclase domain-containing protein [bacterium]|nr:MAG: adenylate/guanylate cyclase domain-containing protein [bacterium]
MGSSRRALAAALLLLGLAGAGLARSELLGAFELKTLDWRFRRFAAPPPADPGLTLVYVDQQSLDAVEKEGFYWPWPRGVYEGLLAFCNAGGAKAVVFDVLFNSPSPYGTPDDEAFAKALKGTNTVLATGGAGPGRLPHPLLRAAAGRLGDASARADLDGVYRRVPLSSVRDGEPVPTLAAAAVLAAGGDRALAEAPRQDGGLLLRFRPANAYPTLPAARLLQSWQAVQEGRKPDLDPSVLKGRIVLVGLSAPGLLDLRPTPVRAAAPGTEAVATAVDNILNGDFLRRAPGASALLSLLALAAGAASALRLRQAWQAGLAAAGASFLLAAAAVGAFRSGFWVDMVLPQLALWSAFAGGSAWGYAVEGRKKRDIQKAFSLYLAPEMVAEIAANPDALALGGKRCELSCYFSDIENFTNFSEKLTPEKLTALMNRYLGEMTDTVLASGGTLDKYIGDAVMAFWGAPLPHPGHALTACKAALRNQERLAVLRETLVREGYPVVKARIGLNSGSASVGNLGSPMRFSYTALGDDVNLASRLEGANKLYGTYILISHATRTQAGAGIEVRELDLIKVKGKDRASAVYELLGLAGKTDPALLARARRYEEALALCRARKFSESIAAFESFIAEHGKDKAALLYIDRCRTLLESPPPEDWDGSFALTEK